MVEKLDDGKEKAKKMMEMMKNSAQKKETVKSAENKPLDKLDDSKAKASKMMDMLKKSQE